MITRPRVLLAVLFTLAGCNCGSTPPGSQDGGSSTGAACASDQTRCGERCVSLTSDPANCGACGTTCATGANATPACGAGRCGLLCATGFADCDGDAMNGCETDTRSSAANCGRCGNTCPAPSGMSASCSAGACMACPGGQTACGARCVDLQSDRANCGACGTGCGPLACMSGACGGLPTLTGASPAMIFGARRTQVTLTGTGFRPGLSVRVNGGLAEVMGTPSATSVVVRTPPLGLDAGPARVEVVNDDGIGAASTTVLSIRGVTTSFAVSTAVTLASTSFYVAAVDVDGDTRPDLVAPRVDTNQVSIARNTGSGFMAPTDVATGPGPFFPVAGDFNGDLRPDLAISARDQPVVYVLLNTGTTFTSGMRSVTLPARGLATGDLNGDGALDLVVGSSSASTVQVLTGQGDGSFNPFATLLASASVPFPGTARVGTDARLAVTGVFTSSETLFVARDVGAAMPNTGFVPVEGAGSNGHAMADLDEDGVPDLLTASRMRGLAMVARGRSDGTFEPGDYVARTLSGPATGVAIADVNGDGAPDLVVAGPSTRLAVYPNEGGGRFTREVLLMLGSPPASVAVADVNGDSKPDLICALGASIGVVLNTSP